MNGMTEQNGKDNFQAILSSIISSLDSENYVAALGMALTIPDICGKLEYPELKRETGKRYKNWYKEYINEENSSIIYPDKPFLPYIINPCDADTAYQLRCSFLHAGKIDTEYLEKKFKDVDDIDDFEFVLAIPNEAGEVFSTGQITETVIMGNNNSTKIEYVINVKELCLMLVKNGSEYHRTHTELFSGYTGLSMLENKL